MKRKRMGAGQRHLINIPQSFSPPVTSSSATTPSVPPAPPPPRSDVWTWTFLKHPLVWLTCFTGALCFAGGLFSYFKETDSHHHRLIDDGAPEESGFDPSLDRVLNTTLLMTSGSMLFVSPFLQSLSGAWSFYASLLPPMSYSILAGWSLWRMIRNLERTRHTADAHAWTRLGRSLLSPHGALFLYSSVASAFHVLISYGCGFFLWIFG